MENVVDSHLQHSFPPVLILILDQVYLFTRFFWICAILLYAIKFISPQFDEWTKYGKLRVCDGTLVSSGLWCSSFISGHLGWISFYAISSLWNLVVCSLLFVSEFYQECVGLLFPSVSNKSSG